MTVKTTLRNEFGTPVGFLETDTDGTAKILNEYGQPLGSFDPKSNQTKTLTGQPVGYGNLLTALLPCPKRR